jgi:hypothetical protein
MNGMKGYADRFRGERSETRKIRNSKDPKLASEAIVVDIQLLDFVADHAIRGS